jgi:hypothetical protein
VTAYVNLFDLETRVKPTSLFLKLGGVGGAANCRNFMICRSIVDRCMCSPLHADALSYVQTAKRRPSIEVVTNVSVTVEQM